MAASLARQINTSSLENDLTREDSQQKKDREDG
jgi:hypothetical protein